VTSPQANPGNSTGGGTQPGEARIDGNEIPTVEARFVQQMPESAELHAALVAPDGRTVYAQVEVPVINAGSLLNQNANYLAGGVAGILSVVLVVWLWRRAKRRRVTGAVFCARCDYDLTSLHGPGNRRAARCPECGADLDRRRPVVGRRAIARIGPPVALLGVVAGATAWFCTAGRRTYPYQFRESSWGSRILLDWSGRRGLEWIGKAATRGDMLLEVDAETGKTRRVVTTRAATTFWPMAFNARANAVYLSRHFGVDLVDLRSGGVLASFALHPPNYSGTNAPAIAGHSGSGRVAYISGSDLDNGRAYLSEWEWRTGRARDIASVEGFQRGDSGYRSSRHYIRVPAPTPRFLQFPDLMEAFPTQTYLVRLLDGDGTVLVEKDLGTDVTTGQRPEFLPDGSLFFLMVSDGRAVAGYDASSLELVGKVTVPGGGGWEPVTVRPDGRLMLVPGARGIYVRDLVEKKWLARLDHPADCYAPRSFTFSDDSLTIGAVFQSDGRNPASSSPAFVFKLAVWVLPESLAVRPPP